MALGGPNIYPFCSPWIGISREIWTDPCPACGKADLEEHGGKHVCPECSYLQPCCNP